MGQTARHPPHPTQSLGVKEMRPSSSDIVSTGQTLTHLSQIANLLEV